jgi:hypothetical protein
MHHTYIVHVHAVPWSLAGPQTQSAMPDTAPNEDAAGCADEAQNSGASRKAAKLQSCNARKSGRSVVSCTFPEIPLPSLPWRWLRNCGEPEAFHTMTASRTSFFFIACITMHGQHNANSPPASEGEALSVPNSLVKAPSPALNPRFALRFPGRQRSSPSLPAHPDTLASQPCSINLRNETPIGSSGRY